MADTTIDLLKNSSYVGKMDELIAAVKSGGGTASDVEWDNVKNKPTTIVGYGITDAKIENGTITLGNQTITPLTSAPVTSVNSKTGAVTLSASDVSAIPSTLTGTAGQVLTKTADGQEWKDVEIPSGTNDHSKLSNRDAADQHPIGAITGLEAALTNIPPTDSFIVTLTQDGEGNNTVDKTFAEIVEAIQSNRATYLYSENMYLPLVRYYPESYVAFGFAATGSASVSSALFAIFSNDHVEIQKTVIKKLPNPNALTFTGAATGIYDGSAPLSVEIPSGGGGAEREWTMLGEIDISVVGGGNIELTELDNFTEFYVTWETVVNESTTASGYHLSINGVSIAHHAIPILKTGTSSNYGWMIARYNGLVWEVQKSGGAVSKSNFTLSYNSALFPYNLLLNVGKATKFQLLSPLQTYQAVSGIIQIYGR